MRLLERLIAMGLLVPLAPLLLLLAVVIRLDSRGPALFLQQRLGHRGRAFAIYKFRTLAADREPPLVVVDPDPHVTRAGRLLRRLKLDELPQLLNVARGEMSLVGPRPETPENLVAIDAEQLERWLSERPGITGAASLELIAENDALADHPDPVTAYRQVIIPAKVQRDIEYQQRRTLLSDLGLLAATPFRVLSPTARAESRRRISALLAQNEKSANGESTREKP